MVNFDIKQGKLENFARKSIRGGIYVRTTASPATALLLDLKIATGKDVHMIFDPSKIKGDGKRKDWWRKYHKDSRPECFLIDHRKDKNQDDC